jgi:hypothetical protein
MEWRLLLTEAGYKAIHNAQPSDNAGNRKNRDTDRQKTAACDGWTRQWAVERMRATSGAFGSTERTNYSTASRSIPRPRCLNHSSIEMKSASTFWRIHFILSITARKLMASHGIFRGRFKIIRKCGYKTKRVMTQKRSPTFPLSRAPSSRLREDLSESVSRINSFFTLTLDHTAKPLKLLP